MCRVAKSSVIQTSEEHNRLRGVDVLQMSKQNGFLEGSDVLMRLVPGVLDSLFSVQSFVS